MANGLPLFEALADGKDRQVVQALAPQPRAPHASDASLGGSEGVMTATASTNTVADVVIMGGGLAGLTLALQLRQRFEQLDIVVLERLRHPVPAAAHKVGESSVEIGAHYFDTVLGLKEHLSQQQLKKFGFRFFFSEGQRASRSGHRAGREPLPLDAELSARSRHLRELSRRARPVAGDSVHRRRAHRGLHAVGRRAPSHGHLRARRRGSAPCRRAGSSTRADGLV